MAQRRLSDMSAAEMVEAQCKGSQRAAGLYELETARKTYRAGPCGIKGPHGPHIGSDWECDGKTIYRFVPPTPEGDDLWRNGIGELLEDRIARVLLSHSVTLDPEAMRDLVEALYAWRF